jgi:hypothetical protein
MRNAAELMQINPFMPRDPIEALDIGILSWLDGLNIDEPSPVSVASTPGILVRSKLENPGS